jgi:hypothetical protein
MVAASCSQEPETTDTGVQRTLESLLSSAKRELAILNSIQSGTDALPFEHRRRQLVDAASIRQQFQSKFDRSPHSFMLLDPGPGLTIIDINSAYAAATLIARGDVVGRSLFEVFPDNPNDALADGVSNLYSDCILLSRLSCCLEIWIKPLGEMLAYLAVIIAFDATRQPV